MALEHTISIIPGVYVQKEAIAAAAINPGNLVEITSATADTVQNHSSAGQPAQRAFAVEDEGQGNEIGDAYVAANEVVYRIFAPGAEVLAHLANGQNAAKGDFLESNGDGTLRVYAASSAGAVEYPSSIVGIAMEAVDMSGSSGADPATDRIRIEIM